MSGGSLLVYLQGQLEENRFFENKRNNISIYQNLITGPKCKPGIFNKRDSDGHASDYYCSCGLLRSRKQAGRLGRVSGEKTGHFRLTWGEK